jgi:hypothetical protein
VASYPANASQLWGESFTINDTDLEFVNNLLLDEGAPMESERLAVAVIRERLQNEAKRRAHLNPDDTIYLPRHAYRIGQQLVFPLLGFSRGTVISVRPGENPEAGPFEVVRVRTEGVEREFASRLERHKLNDVPLETLMGGGEQSPEQILREHSETVLGALEARLGDSPDIAKIADRWFPRSLLVDISHGHLNLAEAVLDVAGGGPLPTSALLEHIELPGGVDPRLAAFSLDYALYRDERFDEVGPAGEMAWFLQRLEPPEVTFPPRRLAYEPGTAPAAALSETLQKLAGELNDEWGPEDNASPENGEESLFLSFPHWRVGTLPLNPRLARIFPHAHQATRIRFTFVDAQTGERFPGWVVTPFRFVFGLAEWYPKKGRSARGGRPGRRHPAPGARVGAHGDGLAQQPPDLHHAETGGGGGVRRTFDHSRGRPARGRRIVAADERTEDAAGGADRRRVPRTGQAQSAKHGPRADAVLRGERRAAPAAGSGVCRADEAAVLFPRGGFVLPF